MVPCRFLTQSLSEAIGLRAAPISPPAPILISAAQFSSGSLFGLAALANRRAQFNYRIDAILSSVGQPSSLRLAAVDFGRPIGHLLELRHDLRVRGARVDEFQTAGVA
jgi:hypothetical protein